MLCIKTYPKYATWWDKEFRITDNFKTKNLWNQDHFEIFYQNTFERHDYERRVYKSTWKGF